SSCPAASPGSSSAAGRAGCAASRLRSARRWTPHDRGLAGRRDRVRGAGRGRAARADPRARVRPSGLGPSAGAAGPQLPRRPPRQPRGRRERRAGRPVRRLAARRRHRGRARRGRHRPRARLRREPRRVRRAGARLDPLGSRRQARPLLDRPRRPEDAPDAGGGPGGVRTVSGDGTGGGAAADGRELARRTRCPRRGRPRRRDLCVPARACTLARGLAGAGVRGRDLRRLRPRRGDLRADARPRGRRRQRRRSAQRRAARRARSERARRARPRARPSVDLGGLGARRRARDGVPAVVIERILHDRARSTPNRIAIDYEGRLVTYAELAAGADAYAVAFAEAGLRRGDRVATLTGNTPEHVEVFFACARLGLMLLPLSWRLTACELRYQLDDAEPSLFLVEDEYRGLAEQTGYRFDPFETATSGAWPRHESVTGEDGLLLVYTSGTTGKPKGAV